MATKELVVTAASGTVREAAIAAADTYGADELDQHAKALIEAWTAKMKQRTDEYTKAAMSNVTKAIAGPYSGSPGGPVYPWWNILVAGPFQPTGAGGPFLPHKIFEASEPAFMLGAVWMNPAGINWLPGPSAATIMGAFSLTIRCETINLTSVTNGPDPAPVVMSPIGSWAGPSWFKPFYVSIGSGFFSAPPNGQPHLYEMNVTADVSGPVPEPFAGYSTWVFDPDFEPAIFPPSIVPSVGAHWQYDIPARFLVYTA